MNREGDLRREQGNLTEAIGAYDESLDIRRRPAQDDPSNATAQRDLSNSLDKVGNVQQEQGNLAEALGANRESLAISRRLSVADPSNTSFQRGPVVSLFRLATLHEQLGEPAEALRFAKNASSSPRDWRRSTRPTPLGNKM